MKDYLEAIAEGVRIALEKYGVKVSEESVDRWLASGYSVGDAAYLAAGE